MAELLVHEELPVTAASRCVVWNKGIKKHVEGIVEDAGADFPPIELESPNRRHWFTNFAEGGKSSLVKGPQEIKLEFENACEEIAEERGKHVAAAPFRTLTRLLMGLQADFGCISHCDELVGLESENGIHKLTVDNHTKEVVAKLLALPEYEDLEAKPKRLVELAAYLHDIGKGPRSRWDDNGGLQKVDPNHPVRAMPMMVDIMTRQVAKVKQTSAEVVTKLVCYHDLVGDVLGKGRDEQQIIEVATDEEELEMLFALGKADATSLVEEWWDEKKADDLYDRCLEAIQE